MGYNITNPFHHAPGNIFVLFLYFYRQVGLGFTNYFNIADNSINRLFILLPFIKIDAAGVALDLVNRFNNVINSELPASRRHAQPLEEPVLETVS